MCKLPLAFGKRRTARLAFAGMTAALLAGCADSSRFIGAPLGNPFHSASNEPSRLAQGGAGRDLPSRDLASREMTPPPPYRPVRTASVTSRPLAPPADMPSRQVADYESPAHASPHLASNYVPPRTERTASIPAPSGHGSWSADGGMAVIAANGETAGVLAQRYNVPMEALLHENGLSSAAQIHPGTRVVIPVYNANGGGAPVRAAAAVEQPASKVHDHSARARLLAKHENPAKDAQAREMQAKREADAKREEIARREDAARQAKQVADARTTHREAAEHDKLRWVKGPQPAADKLHGREKAMGKLAKADAANAEAAQRKAAELKTAELKAAKEARTAALAQQKAAQRTAQADAARAAAAPAPVREQSVKVAKVEDAPVKKAAVDPTPTASLPPPGADKPSANGNPEFRWPAHGRIIQGFKSGGNDGINIALPEGTAVKAAENGVVAYAGSEIKGLGNLVLIRHPNGYVTAYANNGDLQVKRGEQVKRGQTVAVSGQSGNVSSPQLHFELRKGSTPVDPTRYLAGL